MRGLGLKVFSVLFFVKLIYLISRVSLAWIFLNFLAHCELLHILIKSQINFMIHERIYQKGLYLYFSWKLSLLLISRISGSIKMRNQKLQFHVKKHLKFLVFENIFYIPVSHTLTTDRRGQSNSPFLT